MSDTQNYPLGQHPELPPPFSTSGPIHWIRTNLLSSPLNIILTLISVFLVSKLIIVALSWFILNASFGGVSRNDCNDTTGGLGACWGFISVRIDQFIFGFYPKDERWRVIICFFLLPVALYPILFQEVAQRKKLLIFSLIYPFLAGWLLLGGFGLKHVETNLFGGFMLTMIIGVTGIVASLPLGILLALGRQSELSVVRTFSVMFIEFMRGVPLITLLFVASTMLNYFLPKGTTFDLLLRVLIMVTLFSAAYIAEVVRGGLQAIPKGQQEAADAMGLKYWQSMRLIILPQALKISIPGIVNTFIGLYKDSTLVIVIGLFDLLGMGRAALADSKWQGLTSEVYVFVAIFFFITCFSMARYSLFLERKLHTGH